MPRRDIGTDDPRVRVRPGRSKPRRSKKRVDYSQAPIGYVFAVDRGRYQVLLEEQEIVLNCVKARELGRHGIVVGDRVQVQGDLSGQKDTLARIVTVLPRETVLTRSVEDAPGAKEKPMVANAKQLAIVTACADPAPRPGMVDRCLVAAFASGLQPLLVLTKEDLVSAQPMIDLFQPLAVPFVVTSANKGTGFSALANFLTGVDTVLVGHSGVGKSTLMNQLIPEANRETGQVNQVTGRGRHTSTSVRAIRFQSSWLIDTPGIRSFGLAHIEKNQIFAAFPKLQEVVEYCPKNCDHLPETTGCKLPIWAAAEEGRLRLVRSVQRLLISQNNQNSFTSQTNR